MFSVFFNSDLHYGKTETKTAGTTCDHPLPPSGEEAGVPPNRRGIDPVRCVGERAKAVCNALEQSGSGGIPTREESAQRPSVFSECREPSGHWAQGKGGQVRESKSK